ncbi:MAG: hypothetical protein J6I62_01550, partial [Selenomonadaceae bacterium]|nr:hypothetical protein [Selenomonadaceae bacterium]
MVCVEFIEKDYGKTINTRSAAEGVAKFLCNCTDDNLRLRYIRNFCQIIRRSYDWSIQNYLDQLEHYFNRLRNMKITAALDEDYFNRVKKLFNNCKTDDDINIIRGLATEYLIWQACRKTTPRTWIMKMGC